MSPLLEAADMTARAIARWSLEPKILALDATIGRFRSVEASSANRLRSPCRHLPTNESQPSVMRSLSLARFA